MTNKNHFIDAKPLMQNGWHLVRTGESNRFLASMSLADVPTVDAVEVVHGRWIGGYSGIVYAVPKCSQCGYGNGAVGATNYCPNCGADMRDGGKTNE